MTPLTTAAPSPSSPAASAPAAIADGAVCKPNISSAGRRMRRRAGYFGLTAAAAGLAMCLALRVPWYWRGLVVLPAAALSAISFLQARRGTCVARAAEGTFEHDDFSKTRTADGDAKRSRRAAALITRDSVLLAVLAGTGAAATALLR